MWYRSEVRVSGTYDDAAEVVIAVLRDLHT
jgi:hypothetical protein